MKKILVVDDDQSFREYLRDILQGEYLLSYAEDGLTGLEKAKSVDLVITDFSAVNIAITK